VLLDLNADWSVAATYLNGPGIDNHLRQTSATAGISYYLTDHLGSTSGLTDSSGNIVEQIAYDSFGNSSGPTFCLLIKLLCPQGRTANLRASHILDRIWILTMTPTGTYKLLYLEPPQRRISTRRSERADIGREVETTL
jgi:hypothetical protein